MDVNCCLCGSGEWLVKYLTVEFTFLKILFKIEIVLNSQKSYEKNIYLKFIWTKFFTSWCIYYALSKPTSYVLCQASCY